MVGGANRYHDAPNEGRVPGGRTMGAGPVLAVPLRATLLAALGLVFAGMVVQTVADVIDLGESEDGQADRFAAHTLRTYGLFALGAGLLWGASETRTLATGARVGLLVMGVLLVVWASTERYFDLGLLMGGLFSIR